MPSKNKVVVLTGAGISAESGLSTFRDSGGLWEGFDVQEVASIDGWHKNPKKVLDFYNLRRSQAAKVKPNSTHFAIKDLEDKFEVKVITQNVDDLHERAGSSDVVHLHGELRKARSEFDPDEVIEIGDKEIHLGDVAVYPAASLIHYAKKDARKFIIDPTTPETVILSEWTHIQKKATDGVPKLVNELITNF